jgi:acetate---CoA ligase (ADP-forming)
MRKQGLVVIGGTRQGLAALDRMGRWALDRMPLRRSGLPPQVRLSEAPYRGRRTINEFDAKRLLVSYGIPVAREERVETAAEAAKAAEAIGYPVVLKALSDEIAHKTELGLVAVNLKTPEDLSRAFDGLIARLAKSKPRPGETAFLVQEFVADGVEVFAGVSRDPSFGLSLAFGIGGVAVEAIGEFALRMLPLRVGDPEAMIAETRGATLLGRLRGREAADVQSLAACLYSLADFACDNAAVLAEVDLNPIKVFAGGGRGGCVVIDALIVTRPDADQ